MPRIPIVGYDSGCNYVKAVAGEDEKLIFPSVYDAEPRSESRNSFLTDMGGPLPNRTFNIENMAIEFNGQEYLLGERAIEKDDTGGIIDMSHARFKKESEKVRLMGTISLLDESPNVIIACLVTGLSIVEYRQHNEEMKQLYSNETFTFRRMDRKCTLRIRDVICIPQGMGAYFDQTLDMQGKETNPDVAAMRYGVIDIGGRTVDGFIARGREPVPNTEIGLELGLMNAFRAVARSVSDLPITVLEKQYLSGEKIFWNGEYYDIKDACQKEFKNLALLIYSRVMDVWANQMRRVETILLCGGGANVLKEFLDDLFEIELRLAEDAQFSNARGFYKIGLMESSGRQKE